MKKLTILMSLMLAFAMVAAACGDDESDSDTGAAASQAADTDAPAEPDSSPDESAAAPAEPEPEAAEPVTLQFWTWFPSEGTWQRVIDGFEAANPDINVEISLFQNVAYQDRLPLALTSGDTIDIAAVQTSTMVNLVKPDLDPLAPLFDQHASAPLEETLVPAAFSQSRVLADDGELYIAPMGFLGSAAAYYNVDLLDELGLEVPSTRADLKAFVESVESQRPDLLPISFTGDNWFLDEIVLTVTEQIEPGFFNSVRYDAGGAWNSSTYAAAFEAVTSAFDEGIFSQDVLDLDYGRAIEVFQSGEAVMFLQGTWESGILSEPFRDSNGIALSNVTASPLPLLTDGGEHSIRAFIEVGLSVPSNSEHKAEAVRFIEYVTSGDGVDLWVTDLPVVPARAGYAIPADAVFSTDRAAAGYDSISAVLTSPGSDRNNVSDFSAAAGDAVIDSIISGTSVSDQVEFLQDEWESGRYSNVG
ncbi:MAG: extracellular solute-binding protein [Acidimicrobiaceae bacterium]|nr:extracellular solute-binding protein [Acidimicrobiaceae bacterium]MCY4295341.1 extracellular solute-binding protein [Acidimicrobiaceae bacterium]